MSWFGGISDSMDMSLSKLQWTGKPGVLQSMGLQRVRHDLETEEQQNEDEGISCLFVHMTSES